MSLRTIIVDDEPLARDKLRSFLSRESDVVLVGEAANGDEAIQLIERQKPGLAFLDVQMPGMDGFQTLESIPLEDRPMIVFVTAHDQFAVKAFEVHATDYLLKPFDQERFQITLNRIRDLAKSKSASPMQEQLETLLREVSRKSSPASQRLAVKSDGRIKFINVADIDWIEAADNYLKLHCGKESVMHRETMASMESRLDPARFVRINRSTLVNTARIVEMHPLFHGDHAVVLQDGTRLTLSRSRKDKLDLLLNHPS